jgi:hypothetical protein
MKMQSAPDNTSWYLKSNRINKNIPHEIYDQSLLSELSINRKFGLTSGYCTLFLLLKYIDKITNLEIYGLDLSDNYNKSYSSKKTPITSNHNINLENGQFKKIYNNLSIHQQQKIMFYCNIFSNNNTP